MHSSSTTYYCCAVCFVVIVKCLWTAEFWRYVTKAVPVAVHAIQLGRDDFLRACIDDTNEWHRFRRRLQQSQRMSYTDVLRAHTHPFNGPFPGLPRWAGTRKVKPIVLKQETVSGSGISWDICKSAPRFRHVTMPAPRHSVFLQAGCPSCRPTSSSSALVNAFTCAMFNLLLFTVSCGLIPVDTLGIIAGTRKHFRLNV